MTCIAGFISDGRAYIGGDSAATRGEALTICSEPKVFRNGDYLFGCAGSFRQLQVLRYEFEPPSPPEDISELMPFLVRVFIRNLRNCLYEARISHQNNNERQEKFSRTSALVIAHRDQIFEIECDYNITRNADSIAAVGSGAGDARASLATLQRFPSIPPEEKLNIALEIAEVYTSSVRRPFTILHT